QATSNNYQAGTISNQTYFRRIITSGNCAADTAVMLSITVEDQPSNNFLSAGNPICTGTIPDLITGSMPSGGSGQYQFLWQSSADQIFWTQVSGESTQHIQLPMILQTVYIRRIIHSGVCAPDTTSVVSQVV